MGAIALYWWKLCAQRGGVKDYMCPISSGMWCIPGLIQCWGLSSSFFWVGLQLK